MRSISQTQQILQALKGLLKQHSLNYAHVAKQLDLSESSIKRVFSSGQISLNRIVEICAMMDLEISDLLQALQNQNLTVSKLTEKQERLITSDIKLLLVTVCVFNNWTFDEIHATYDFQEAELIGFLLKLEKIQVLELKPGNKIRLKVSQHFHWLKNGPIQNYFVNQIQNDFMQCTFTGPGELRLVLTGMLCKESNKHIQQKMNKIAVEFNQFAQQDKLLPMQARHGTNLLMALRPWEITQFDQLRRAENKKVFL